MKHHASAAHSIVQLVAQRGIIRARELAEQGYSRETIRRLVADGRLVQRSRGIYAPASAEPSDQETVATVALRVSHAVLCLLSALRFHNLTTQNPTRVWIAIDNKAWSPRTDLPIRVVRFSGDALTAGVETHQIDNVSVRVYSAAKTVADCFKFRNKIGTDVALEALRDCLANKRASIDDVWRFAAVCRVTNVMRPYLESLAA